MNTLRLQMGAYIKDAVYAANDGIVTTFAVVAGVAGAALDPIVVLILGFASLFADGFSMASGNFLGSRSEVRVYERQRRGQERSLQENPQKERGDIEYILASRGYEGEKLRAMLDLIMDNKQFAVDLMMDEEVHILKPEDGRPLRSAFVTFFSFIAVGLVPLLPYLFVAESGAPFFYAVLFTGAVLFGVGAVRVIFMGGSWLWAGVEMLLVGGFAAAISYGIGAFLRGLVG